MNPFKPWTIAIAIAIAIVIVIGSAMPAAHAGQLLADPVHPSDGVKLLAVQAQLGDVGHAADGVEQRAVIFHGAQSWLRLAPAQGGWNVSGAGGLRLRIQNGMAWALTVRVDIEDAEGGHLRGDLALPPGPPQNLLLPLKAVSPRALGMQAGPPIPWRSGDGLLFAATRLDGRLDPRRIVSVSLGVPAPGAPQTLLLGALARGDGDPLRQAYAAIIDRYGQYSRGQWPEKVADDASLKIARQRERSQLSRELGERRGLDRYGGRMDIRGLHATGWFHTAKLGEQWLLVTPEGHAFFSLGVNAVAADGGRSYLQRREWMFTGLPPDRGPWAAFYGHGDSRQGDASSRAGIGFNHGRWFDFYAANLYRADGGGWLAEWRARTLDRLRAWGFNTVGNWSDDALGAAHRLPYTRPIYVRGDYANVSAGYDYWGRMPDPFDPRFTAAAERAVAKAADGVRDDPYLLGYFADNELAWAGTGPQGRWGLALGTLAGAAASPAKQAFIAGLKKKYRTPAALAAAWGMPLDAWQALDAEGFRAPLPDEAHPALAADYSAWLRRYADAYFRTVAEAIRRHDPHHLFLGGRFAVNTPEAVAACAQYCDVISFNVYADLPQHGIDLAAAQVLDKPVLISEFHFGSDDRGPFGKGVVSVYTEQQRGEAYAAFVRAAAASHELVGAHWFQYVDQPTSGRLLDGENSHIGLVGITDIPFGGFVEAVTAANRQAATPSLPRGKD